MAWAFVECHCAFLVLPGLGCGVRGMSPAVLWFAVVFAVVHRQATRRHKQSRAVSRSCIEKREASMLIGSLLSLYELYLGAV